MIVILEDKDFYEVKRIPKDRKVVEIADLVIDKEKREIIKTRFDFNTTIKILQDLENFKGMDISYALQEAKPNIAGKINSNG